MTKSIVCNTDGLVYTAQHWIVIHTLFRPVNKRDVIVLDLTVDLTTVSGTLLGSQPRSLKLY
jgi:hypothetical protein